MNRLYFESLVETTDVPWELIVVDNNSTDGSREFFESLQGGEHGLGTVRVIANRANYSYPYSQNQGIDVARGDVYAFLNNDILLSKNWASRMLEVLGKDGYEVLTLSSNERLHDSATTRRIFRRWKHFKYPMLKVFGSGRWSLRTMVRLTYGDWQRYASGVWDRYGKSILTGFCGSAVLMTRRAVERLGRWDERVQAGDFDLFYRSMKYYEEHGDIKPMSVVNGVAHHHYQRLTLKNRYQPFTDADRLIALEDKWTTEEMERYNQALKF